MVKINKIAIGVLVVFALMFLGVLFLIYFDILKIAPSSIVEQPPPEGIKEAAIQELAEKSFSGTTGIIVSVIQAIIGAIIIYFASKLGADVQPKVDMTLEELKNQVILPRAISDYGLIAVEGADKNFYYNKEDLKIINQRRYNKPEGNFIQAEVFINGMSSSKLNIFDFRKDLDREQIIGGDYTFDEDTNLDSFWKRDERRERTYPKFRYSDPIEKRLELGKSLGKESYEEILRSQVEPETKQVKISVEKEKEKERLGERPYVETQK